MSTYRQFCPIAKGAEVFAERWTPLILRELLQGSHHFNELRRGLPGMSQSLLVRRLDALEGGGVIERRPGARAPEYHLTEAGAAFAPVIEALGAWGQQWARQELVAEDLDPGLLMWFLYRHIPVDRLPAARLSVRFDFSDAERTFWLRLERPEVDLCLEDPGGDDDLVVRTDVETLASVYLGRISLRAATDRGLIDVEGPRSLVAGLPNWIGISGLATYARRDPGALPGGAHLALPASVRGR